MRAPIRLACIALWATAALPVVAAEPRWPTPNEIDAARNRTPLPSLDSIQGGAPSGIPKISPRQPDLDLQSMARRFAGNQQAVANAKPEPQLRILVTLAMPEASLRLLAAQAAQSGATLVIRGLKDDSMTKTLAAVQRVIGEQTVDWQIDPPAFTRFAVTRAPTIVLSPSNADTSQARSCITCAITSDSVSVAGDVSLAYALDYIARAKPSFAADAQRFLARINSERPR